MRSFYLILGLGILMILYSCNKGGSTASSSSKKVEDDLTKYSYKPKAKDTTAKGEATVVVPKNFVFEKQINGSLDPLLDSMAVANKRYQSAQGFRIMLYSGNSSEEAAEVKKQVYDLSTDYDVYMQYKQPAFRLKVGNFPDRISANYAYSDLVKFFPTAVIIPDQIEIK